MCGIVGAISAYEPIAPVLLQGLARLEYRGYDSCGVAVLNKDGLHRSRSTQRVADLGQRIAQAGLNGTVGIAHTRWATHGAPETANAHPHFSTVHGIPQLALVHNGIIENHEALRQFLQQQGFVFESQTDTEVIAHLIQYHYQGDLRQAVHQAIAQLQGAFAIAVMHCNEPKRLLAARRGSPLVVGLCADASFVASDTMALAGFSQQIIYLEEGDVADLSPGALRLYDAEQRPVSRASHVLAPYTAAAELGPYRHFMQKEIFEQPRAIADTLQNIDSLTPALFGQGAAELLAPCQSLLILACGTSYYAGLTAKYWVESLAGLPVHVEIASEYRYRDTIPHPDQLVVTVSQSGETADTLAALRHAKAQGMHRSLAICNVASSAMVRECALHFLTKAGVEVGVASTKAFTTQLVSLFMLALVLAKQRGRLSAQAESDYLRQLRHLPTAIHACLALEPQVIAWAEHFVSKEHALFLGRGLHYPIALEGALKLKEISYIHAEAYPAGELKHGPLALVTDAMPVVVIAPNNQLLEKLKSNMQEVRARGGELYVFADADAQLSSQAGIHVLPLPEHYGALSPIVHTIPLQLLAYHTAIARGTDVDKPRNLAKSVTVE